MQRLAKHSVIFEKLTRVDKINLANLSLEKYKQHAETMTLDVFLSIDGIREGKLSEAEFQTVLQELRATISSRSK